MFSSHASLPTDKRPRVISGFSCEDVPKCQEGITTTHYSVFKTNPE